MKTRRRIRTGVRCLLLLLALVGVMVSFVRRNRPLLERSTPVADTRDWWQQDRVDCPYQWLSDHTLFSHSGWWRLQNPFTYDTRTKLKTPLSTLQRHLEQDADGGTSTWTLSPDRQRIAWTMELNNDVRTARLDGSDYQSVAVATKGHGNALTGVEWMADSRHWLTGTIDYVSGKDTGIALGDIRTPGKLTWLSQEQTDRLDIATEVQDTKSDSATVVLPDSAPTLRGATLSKGRTITIKPPHGMNIVELEPDPSRHRLLWLLSGRSAPPWLLSNRFLQLTSTEPDDYTAFYISRIDGTELREIGRIYPTKADPSDVAWLPDGKQISYLYQDKLYTVSIE